MGGTAAFPLDDLGLLFGLLLAQEGVGLLGGGAAEGALHAEGGALALGGEGGGDEGDLLRSGQRGALGLGGEAEVGRRTQAGELPEGAGRVREGPGRRRFRR